MYKKNKMFIDILWYGIGFAIPTLVTLAKTPIFTRYFTAQEYGYLGIVNTTFSYISIIVYSWINSCVWRFFNYYKNKDELNVFYSCIITAYVFANAVTIVICFIWIGLYREGNVLIKQLIVQGCIQSILTQILGIYLTIVRLKGESLKYNIINVCISVFSFIVLILLTFCMHFRIESMIESTVIINIILIVYITLTYLNKIKACVSVRYVSMDVIKKMICYGFPAVIGNLSVIVLTSSDRYIIAFFSTMDSVGVYDQIYNLSQVSIAALSSIYYNAINPVLFKELENNYEKYNDTAIKYTTIYICLLLPFTVYFSLFSKQICFLLLGESFRSGYIMMPFVMFSTFIYGISQFNQDILRFGNRLYTLIKGVLISAILNILLNVVLIPFYGYEIAAFTTLISYIVLYLFFYFNDSLKYFNSIKNYKGLSLICITLTSQVVIDLLLRRVFKVEINIIYTIFEGIVFLLIYFIVLKRKNIVELGLI